MVIAQCPLPSQYGTAEHKDNYVIRRACRYAAAFERFAILRSWHGCSRWLRPRGTRSPQLQASRNRAGRRRLRSWARPDRIMPRLKPTRQGWLLCADGTLQPPADLPGTERGHADGYLDQACVVDRHGRRGRGDNPPVVLTPPTQKRPSAMVRRVRSGRLLCPRQHQQATNRDPFASQTDAIARLAPRIAVAAGQCAVLLVCAPAHSSAVSNKPMVSPP
jgi:hypothetical protein